MGILEVHATVAGIDLRVGVFEATDTSHSTEVMVESAVLLHKQNDMLNICNRSSKRCARKERQRPSEMHHVGRESEDGTEKWRKGNELT